MVWTGSGRGKTAQISYFSAFDMPKRSYGRKSQNLRTCVCNSESQSRTGVSTGPVGLNKHHEARLITSLVDWYGWTLCADGNLYNPFNGKEAHAA